MQDQKKHTAVGSMSRGGGLLGRTGCFLGRHGEFGVVCYLDWRDER